MECVRGMYVADVFLLLEPFHRSQQYATVRLMILETALLSMPVSFLNQKKCMDWLPKGIFQDRLSELPLLERVHTLPMFHGLGFLEDFIVDIATVSSHWTFIFKVDTLQPSLISYRSRHTGCVQVLTSTSTNSPQVLLKLSMFRFSAKQTDRNVYNQLGLAQAV